MRFTLRESRPDDFDRLHAIDQECFPAGIAYSRRELAKFMKLRGAFTLVAEDDQKIAGFIIAQKHPRRMGHVVTIDVLTPYRRSGLGSLLMNEVESRLRADGCDAMFLETAVDNTAAIRFYERFGYVIVKKLPAYYPDGLDGYLLVKRFARHSSKP